MTMAEVHSEKSDRESDTLEQPKANAAEGGSSSGRRAHKGSAFRNFFKRTPSNQEGGVTPRGGATPGSGVTPRSGGASARAGAAAGSGHQASVSGGEDDFEDHMNGSPFTRTDICKSCGFPRGSSVCCPVTRRHHGTDEVMTPGRNHSRSPSGGMGIMARIRGKLPLTPGRRANHPGSEEGEEHTPQTNELAPLSLTAHAGPDDEDAEADGGPKATPLLRNHTMSPLNPNKDAVKGDGDGDGAGDSPAEEVQYYCYTDEKGDTYYYQPEGREATQAPPAPQNASQMEVGENGEASDGDGTYVYQYVDENGQTVNCLCTPQADADDAAAAGGPLGGGDEDAVDRATPATSAAAHAGSDTANSSEPDDAVAPKKKTPSSFFAAIQNVFKPRRDSHPQEQHEDPLQMGEANATAQTPPSEAHVDGTTSGDGTATQGCVDPHEYDLDVANFMELLDSSEKKKFMKERKVLIKELSSSEKKERESIMKNRQDGLAAFSRDRLAVAFAIRKDERTIKTGQKRGEPL